MRRFGLAMVCIAVTVLVVSVVRLGGTLAQLRAIEAPAAVRIDVREASTVAPRESAAATPQVPTERAPLDDVSGAHAILVSDRHILRALADDAEFKRAAAELLQDRDPAVRAEAEQLLRDLGL
jgi:hypothetical protein